MPDQLTDWVGNQEIADDLVTGWPARALHATLGLAGPPPDEGDALPPLWHWLYFLATVDRRDLGVEGHATLGGFLPPVPLPRRMFAGGRFEFRAPLRIGDRAQRQSTVTSVQEKQGRSGPLVFVTVRHMVETASGPVIEEEQHLVYREAAAAPERPQPGTEPVPAAAWTETVTPDEILLFRFSALTFNSHRIHYDQYYASQVEGYPGLIVHGPLLAMLLAGMARSRGPKPLRRFSFRARAPVFLGGRLTLLGDPTDDSAALSVWSHDRRLAMTAEASYGG